MMCLKVFSIGFLWLIVYCGQPWKAEELMAMGLMYGLVCAIVEAVTKN